MLAAVHATLDLTCAAAHILLIGLILLRGRTSRAGAAMVFCCALTTAWAGSAAFPGLAPARVAGLVDSLRLAAWLLFMAGLAFSRGSRAGRGRLLAAAAVCVLILLYDGHLLVVDPGGDRYYPLGNLLRIGLGVAGLVAVENVWRNSAEGERWHIWPICLPIGGIFAYELFVSADALMMRSELGPDPMAGRAIVAILTVPLLALAMARNRDWRIDIHISREVVLHSAALTASGLFLLVVGCVGIALNRLGGVWGVPLQLTALIGSAFVLGIVLSSHRFWRSLKSFISRNFFSNRYDYRVEWLRFVDRISNPAHADELQVKIIAALAEFVDSPAGVLWSMDGNAGFQPTASWRLPVPTALRLSADARFVSGFRGGSWIQVRGSAGEAGDEAEYWPDASPRAWLAVPLSRAGEIVGFVVLDRPHHNVTLDWESFDLLRSAGSQAASYLAEERTTKALRDSVLLNDYNQRFAFVVHDIRNLASQLGLVMTNARRHIDDPEFRGDMLQTIDESIARMNRLLSQLTANSASPSPPSLNPGMIIDRITAGFPEGAIIVESQIAGADCAIAIDAERLGSALTHLVQNAIEASPPGEAVRIRASRRPNELVIEVVDHGSGMDSDFVRNELFRPFRSTKSTGFGIGAFQARELIRATGGDLDVISQMGRGTTMRVVLPFADGAVRAAPPAVA